MLGPMLRAAAGNGGVAGDPYFNDVVSLLLFGGVDGSTSFTDETGKIWTAGGDAQIDTEDTPAFVGGVLLLDGNGDIISTPASTDFDLGDQYTIEYFIKPLDLSVNFGVLHRGFYSTTNSSWNGLSFSIRHFGDIYRFYRFYFYGTTGANEQYIEISDALTPASNYTHVAMCRDGAVGQVFMGGVLRGAISGLNTPAASSRDLKIGVWDFSAGAEYLPGRVALVRITNAVRYTDDFLPPAGY